VRHARFSPDGPWDYGIREVLSVAASNKDRMVMLKSFRMSDITHGTRSVLLKIYC
jgi:hypothetical protein